VSVFTFPTGRSSYAGTGGYVATIQFLNPLAVRQCLHCVTTPKRCTTPQVLIVDFPFESRACPATCFSRTLRYFNASARYLAAISAADRVWTSGPEASKQLQLGFFSMSLYAVEPRAALGFVK